MTSINWFSTMSLKLETHENNSTRTIHWKRSLFNMQLRVVAFAYHREEFTRLHLQAIADETSEGDPELPWLRSPDSQLDESLSLNAALAAAQVLAASQSLHSACETLFRVFQCATGASDQSSSHDHSHKILLALRSSTEFQYLHGFVELCNEQNLLVMRPRQSLLGRQIKRELSIREFNYSVDQSICSFASKWATEFLFQDCEQLIESCHRLGETLASEMA